MNLTPYWEGRSISYLCPKPLATISTGTGYSWKSDRPWHVRFTIPIQSLAIFISFANCKWKNDGNGPFGDPHEHNHSTVLSQLARLGSDVITGSKWLWRQHIHSIFSFSNYKMDRKNWIWFIFDTNQSESWWHKTTK